MVDTANGKTTSGITNSQFGVIFAVGLLMAFGNGIGCGVDDLASQDTADLVCFRLTEDGSGPLGSDGPLGGAYWNADTLNQVFFNTACERNVYQALRGHCQVDECSA